MTLDSFVSDHVTNYKNKYSLKHDQKVATLINDSRVYFISQYYQLYFRIDQLVVLWIVYTPHEECIHLLLIRIKNQFIFEYTLLLPIRIPFIYDILIKCKFQFLVNTKTENISNRVFGRGVQTVSTIPQFTCGRTHLHLFHMKLIISLGPPSSSL